MSPACAARPRVPKASYLVCIHTSRLLREPLNVPEKKSDGAVSMLVGLAGWSVVRSSRPVA